MIGQSQDGAGALPIDWSNTITMVRYTALCWLVLGCHFDPSGLATVDGDITGPTGSDAGPDDLPNQPRGDGGAECGDWRSSHFDPCTLDTGVAGLDLSEAGTYRYDTDTGILRDPGGAMTTPFAIELVQATGEPARLVVARRITIGEPATLRVTGTASLLLASWSSLTVAGVIDVASHSGAVGAGANPVSCTLVAATAGQSNPAGGGGGGGGGFAASGGAGGGGHLSGGGSAGDAVALAVVLRGGCSGGSGGGAGRPGGIGGAGGGALVLAARLEVVISGHIDAGGAGGGGGKAGEPNTSEVSGGGGGGGGSGGMIVIEAAAVTIASTARLIANGGGGGEGGAWFENGADGDDAITAEQAGGGESATMGGDGGDGGHLDQPGGRDGESLESGGGGGGAVGYIVLGGWEIDLAADAVISPAATMP